MPEILDVAQLRDMGKTLVLLEGKQKLIKVSQKLSDIIIETWEEIKEEPMRKEEPKRKKLLTCG